VAEVVAGTILVPVVLAVEAGFQLPHLLATLLMFLHWQWAAVAVEGSVAPE
jgi:hypothetical protein